MRYRALCAALLAATALACGPAPHTRGAGAVSPLAVRAVPWSRDAAKLGKVRAVADAGKVVAVFSERGAEIFASGVPVATDASVSDWTDAGVLSGAGDRASSSILGVRGNGRLYRLRGLARFEDVTDRFGLAGAPVRDVASVGAGNVALLVGGGIAVADGEHVTSYAPPAVGVTFDQLAGGAGFGAAVTPNSIHVFDVARKTVTGYPLAGVTRAVIGADGRVYAITARAVYAGDATGGLALVYDARGNTIHGLTASGARVWFADGDELGVVQGDGVAETAGAKVGRDATLFPSTSGDVWVASGRGLDRFARAGSEPAGDVTATWDTAIGPIFARSCSACHLPDGISGTDLSNAAAWEDERAHIHERVIEKRSMPPQGHPLSDADREAIRRWLEAPAAAGVHPAERN